MYKTMSKPSDVIIKAKAFDANMVGYKPPVVNKRGGKSVQLQVAGHPVILQIPLMRTWGVNERVNEETGRVSYDISLQFDAGSSSSDKFRAAMEKLQDKILDDAVQNGRSWFGKTCSNREVMKALMYPILKHPKNKETGEIDLTRDPTMKLKIPYWEGKFNVELFDMKGAALYVPKDALKHNADTFKTEPHPTPLTLVPKGSRLNGLIACTGIWMAGGRFGVTWKLLQACVLPPVRLVGTGTCHVQLDSDDEDALAALEADAVPAPVQPAAGPTFDSSGDEEEVIKPVAAPKKKKVVRRKKS